MRVTGLVTLLLGIVFMLLPAYAKHLPFLDVSAQSGQLLGGLMVALGGIALGISRSSGS